MYHSSILERGLFGRRRAFRAEERVKGAQPYVHRYVINFINNPSRLELVALLRSISLTESFVHLGKNGFLGRRRASRARALGRRGMSRVEK